jgi:hypothetical protein
MAEEEENNALDMRAEEIYMSGVRLKSDLKLSRKGFVSVILK